jgi:hypothetical protein
MWCRVLSDATLIGRRRSDQLWLLGQLLKSTGRFRRLCNNFLSLQLAHLLPELFRHMVGITGAWLALLLLEEASSQLTWVGFDLAFNLLVLFENARWSGFFCCSPANWPTAIIALFASLSWLLALLFKLISVVRPKDYCAWLAALHLLPWLLGGPFLGFFAEWKVLGVDGPRFDFTSFGEWRSMLELLGQVRLAVIVIAQFAQYVIVHAFALILSVLIGRKKAQSFSKELSWAPVWSVLCRGVRDEVAKERRQLPLAILAHFKTVDERVATDWLPQERVVSTGWTWLKHGLRLSLWLKQLKVDSLLNFINSLLIDELAFLQQTLDGDQEVTIIDPVFIMLY